MKKIIISLIIFTTLLITYSARTNSSNNKFSDIFLANVEALAQSEESGEYNVMHFDCFDTEGKKTGKCTGASFKGPNGHRSLHTHNCSWCCQ